jgi:glycerophosphoryl diester phosphodiesterase
VCLYFVVHCLLFFVHYCCRGGRSVYAPENTMFAYKKSVYEDHSQIVEFDLHVTKDGVVVLHHDG